MKQIDTIQISFYKRNPLAVELKKEDTSLIVDRWNLGKISSSNNVFFDTILLVTCKSGLTRCFWRNGNKIYENYDLIIESDNLNFLDEYIEPPIYEIKEEEHINSENKNVFAITR